MNSIIQGSVIELNEDFILDTNSMKLFIPRPLRVCVGYIPENNISWFGATLKDIMIKSGMPLVKNVVFVSKSFEPEWQKNEFSIKHLNTPLDEFNSMDEAGKENCLLSLLDKVDNLSFRVKELESHLYGD